MNGSHQTTHTVVRMRTLAKMSLPYSWGLRPRQTGCCWRLGWCLKSMDVRSMLQWESNTDQDRKGSCSQTPSLDWLKILMAKSRVIVASFGVLTTSRLWVGFPQAKACMVLAWLAVCIPLWYKRDSDIQGLVKSLDSKYNLLYAFLYLHWKLTVEERLGTTCNKRSPASPDLIWGCCGPWSGCFYTWATGAPRGHNFYCKLPKTTFQTSGSCWSNQIHNF